MKGNIFEIKKPPWSNQISMIYSKQVSLESMNNMGNLKKCGLGCLGLPVDSRSANQVMGSWSPFWANWVVDTRQITVLDLH